jgi:serine/threonine protein kinase
MEGLRISHYRILRRLGSGGMGEVYAAEDERLRRNVAIKFISHGKAADEKTRRRFEREARAASALNHPNICTIHEVNEHEGQPFLK